MGERKAPGGPVCCWGQRSQRACQGEGQHERGPAGAPCAADGRTQGSQRWGIVPQTGLTMRLGSAHAIQPADVPVSAEQVDAGMRPACCYFWQHAEKSITRATQSSSEMNVQVKRGSANTSRHNLVGHI